MKVRIRRFQHVQGMNNTERRYANVLFTKKLAGEIQDYRYEAMTLILGPSNRYTPDFAVVMPDGELQIHEVKACYFHKGRQQLVMNCRDDALQKWKDAALAFPWFRFFLVGEVPAKSGGGWMVKEYPSESDAFPSKSVLNDNGRDG